MSLIPGVQRKDTCTNNMGTVGSVTMNPPTPLEYGRVSGASASGSGSIVACWGGAGANDTDTEA
jgi:Asp-tRNA(Asn)/Glu-tRNA(Gln) amidotransferase A subunit family amidase